MYFLQQIDEEEYLECIKQLIRTDKEWIPKEEKSSLYIRPHLFGTEVKFHLILRIYSYTVQFPILELHWNSCNYQGLAVLFYESCWTLLSTRF